MAQEAQEKQEQQAKSRKHLQELEQQQQQLQQEQQHQQQLQQQQQHRQEVEVDGRAAKEMDAVVEQHRVRSPSPERDPPGTVHLSYCLDQGQIRLEGQFLIRDR